jgi:hypothetical protein
MADKEIGALTAASTLAGTELAHVVQGANSRKVTTTRVLSEVTHSAASKTTPVDADELAIVDSAASDVLKKLLWSNIKATLKTYFDTLYGTIGGGAPDDADYIVKTATGGLTAERVLTDSANVIWDWSAAGVAKANVVGLGGASPTAPSDFKESAYVATTGNITLSGEQTIDGSLTSASRVLVMAQATGSQNGIYVSAAGAWSRSADADATGEITPGMMILVESGTTNGDQVFICTNSGTITIGSTAITFQAIAVPQAVFVGKNVNGTTYTHILSDGGKRLEFSNAATKTFTVAPQSSVNSPVNTAIKLLNVGAGLLTIAPGSGVTINSVTALTLQQYQCAMLEKRANPNTWVLEFVAAAAPDEVVGGIITIASTAPSSPATGDVWIDTT